MIVARGASYELAPSTIAIEFTVMAEFSGGGARRHPRATIGVLGKAAERLHDFLRPRRREVLKETQINANQLN